MTQENEHFLNKGEKEEKDPLLERVVCDPNILAGKPTIRGTRIPVDIVLANLSVGMDLDELFESYPNLKLDDVKASLRYAYGVLAGEITMPTLPRSTIFEEEEGWIDIPTGWVDTEEERKEFDEHKAEYIKGRLRRMVKRNITQRAKLLRENFPEVYDDAEKFFANTSTEPWDYSMAFLEGGPKDIQEKYNVHFSRQRPKIYYGITPQTDIFYEASELIYQKWTLQMEEKHEISDKIKSEKPDAQPEELELRIDQEMKKRDKEWAVD